MTYKLEPWVEKINAPIITISSDGEHRYDNGTIHVKSVFDKHYVVNELSASDREVILRLVESQPQDNQTEGYF